MSRPPVTLCFKVVHPATLCFKVVHPQPRQLRQCKVTHCRRQYLLPHKGQISPCLSHTNLLHSTHTIAESVGRDSLFSSQIKSQM